MGWFKRNWFALVAFVLMWAALSAAYQVGQRDGYRRSHNELVAALDRVVAVQDEDETP